jgi:signal transduction histidine kinase
MLMSFIVLGIGLVVAVVLQVKVALRPLRAIRSGISKIREGKQDKLHKEYPEDVQLLVDELNNLIEHNAVLLKRARNQLGDLAHSIKNPLTVINNEAQALESEQRQLILDQTIDITKSFDHYLSRARASGSENVLGTRSHIRSVAEDLAFAMKRIHGDSNIDIDITGTGSCSFRGESQDLEEMLGNLMDNACKWANSRMIVSCKPQPEFQRCRLSVEDDGPGIPKSEIQRVLQRGKRLDTTVQGHGLGLSIVQDIVELYGGKLTFRTSELGGLCAELDLPGA